MMSTVLNEGLGSWIERRRVKSGDRAAIVFCDHTLTYRELGDRVDRLANLLTSLGVVPGSRVAYLGENHPAFLETLFATAAIGAIFVPLNTRLAAPEVAFQLADSGSEVLIHAPELSALVAGALPAAALSVAALPAAALPALQAPDAVRHVLPVDTLDELLRTVPGVHPEHPVTLDHPAIILYTSGTTGAPKGAVLTHGNLTWNCLNVLVDYDLVSTDVAVMISPLFHVASLGMGALPAILKGATIVLEPRFDAGRTLAVIEKYRATSISGVPTTFQLLAEHPDWASTDLSSLNKLTCGGSPVTLRVLDAYEGRGLSFTGGYGMTESAPGATSLQPHRSRTKAGSAGLPHFFTDLRIVAADGSRAPAFVAGEIQLSGPNLIGEYWHRPDATAASYAEGQWFRTGDVGYLDDDGFLFISDRLKDMIISGGENIYPVEVEHVILEVESVGAVAVIGVPDEKWGEVPLAVLTARDGFVVDEASIRSHLDGRIARYKQPKGYRVVAELPRTASGKVRKAELRGLFPTL